MNKKTGLSLEIQVARIRKGLTQYELGQLVGQPTYNITRYECGVAIPPPATLAKIKKALGLGASVN